MAVLAALLILFIAAKGSEAAWCVCRSGADQTDLQAAIDYACGNGADCGPINANGPCFQPDNRQAHCSYAVNGYFQKAGQAPSACDFSSAAVATNVDPSYPGCQFPSLVGGGSVTPPTSSPPRQSGFGLGFGPATTGYNPLPVDGTARDRTAGIALGAAGMTMILFVL